MFPFDDVIMPQESVNCMRHVYCAFGYIWYLHLILFCIRSQSPVSLMRAMKTSFCLDPTWLVDEVIMVVLRSNIWLDYCDGEFACFRAHVTGRYACRNVWS